MNRYNYWFFIIFFFYQGYKLGRTGEYLCSHNILKAHARAYHIYHDEFPELDGKLGMTNSCPNYFAKTPNDTDARERAFQFSCGRFLHPVFNDEGDYPEIMKQMINEKSKLEGRDRSKLPVFSKEWIDYIKWVLRYFVNVIYREEF